VSLFSIRLPLLENGLCPQHIDSFLIATILVEGDFKGDSSCCYGLLGRRLGYPTLASLRRVGVLSFPNRDQTHVQEKVSVGHIDEDGNDIKLCDG
jgi:hypothetical protein